MLIDISVVLEGLKEADRIKTNSSPPIGTGGGQENVDVVYGPSDWNKILFYCALWFLLIESQLII